MELTAKEMLAVEHSGLFLGISQDKLISMLNCLPARRVNFPAGDFLLRQGDTVSEVGLVLSGDAASMRVDGQGEPLILTSIEPGGFVGILVASSPGQICPMFVQARTDLSALFFPVSALLSPCSKNCPEHSLLTRNFLACTAQKSLSLNDRIDCLVRRSVREKVTVYLRHMARERGSREFTIPLDREAMAGYLNVDRTALSRELSRMKAEGLLEYRKNFFRLLDLN
ncbi:MAG: Crp/Fnr family transcriptional regulator [Acutalibacter sp.]|nr:Crp/Fnr family transcriptional regulator [Acutalibacter sp.]